MEKIDFVSFLTMNYKKYWKMPYRQLAMTNEVTISDGKKPTQHYMPRWLFTISYPTCAHVVK